MKGCISLKGLEFHAFHGVYPHERESGNWFEVNISIELDFNEASSNDQIQDTVDYEEVYAIVKEEMEKPSKLLETVGGAIVRKIFELFPKVQGVDLEVSKLNPPIGGKCKSATVSISQKR